MLRCILSKLGSSLRTSDYGHAQWQFTLWCLTYPWFALSVVSHRMFLVMYGDVMFAFLRGGTACSFAVALGHVILLAADNLSPKCRLWFHAEMHLVWGSGFCIRQEHVLKHLSSIETSFPPTLLKLRLRLALMIILCLFAASNPKLVLCLHFFGPQALDLHFGHRHTHTTYFLF